MQVHIHSERVRSLSASRFEWRHGNHIISENLVPSLCSQRLSIIQVNEKKYQTCWYKMLGKESLCRTASNKMIILCMLTSNKKFKFVQDSMACASLHTLCQFMCIIRNNIYYYYYSRSNMIINNYWFTSNFIRSNEIPD